MKVAGVDIGNSTTEVALAEVGAPGGVPNFLASSRMPTTGIKGTLANVPGVVRALETAVQQAGLALGDIDLVLLNEATPVIGDIAMETITETIITESSMIGHNPNSPGGLGIGVGVTHDISELETAPTDEAIIAVVPKTYDFTRAAQMLAAAIERGVDVTAAIVQGDDGVLIANRLPKKLPIVDEVKLIDQVPLGMLAAVEVADHGQSIQQLSNPYGIATLFKLTPQETTMIIPIAKALIGLRSAVVIRTPAGDVQTRHIPAGSLKLIGERRTVDAPMDSGADAIMDALAQAFPLKDVEGESGTNVGGMVARVRQTMSNMTKKPASEVHIRDVLAVDCLVPQRVSGGLAQEFSMENAVGLAAMVNTDKLLMEQLAEGLHKELGIKVQLGGVEANMAILGTLTTPGLDTPLAILDLGAGSTDAAILEKDRDVRSVHLAGAGDMVTLLIQRELDLPGGNETDVAEQIKRFPLVRVESLFHVRHEDNTVRFFEEPLDPKLFGRVALITPDGLSPIPTHHTLDRIREVRREAKRRVFVRNAMRALSAVAPAGNIREIQFVAVVGGSGLDFEVARMLTDQLAHYGTVIGTANIRGSLGPVNAVATGLVLSHARHQGAV
ncbi:diol dehydratase reactivase subunit alpha [Afifella marina]|uniref:Diol dehydratase reactivase alpha subunit n=1 Tax=Afifella marina DSM 2698 TaxID=1120955 RepID=A0A1G5NV26_AFIMA|nr:diol dehydratase reactivase subunit alpha [Afifella marina]MBK1624070.1 diol dehydratase reactivase subunit alpha [Afifella marina DSM 2698]MBK1627627.1 diol dehydratase reactivase subunit alpha [Afifella marina]MBK5916351.1 diol dehydratase reactivase subunit alpha [Afifella marina]RAI20913.1 diol dehydratase reactivase subunit alpha [Afifella marina DSM 2698]SCZ41094.1 diol dehydratase reactivase alpha subunit [Afifella marina DSM 2698]